MGLAEHVGLAYHAGGHADGVDGAVELCVRGRHEHLIQAAAALVPRLGQEACLFLLVAWCWLLVVVVFVGGRDIHDERQLVDELKRGGGPPAGQEAHQLVDHAAGDVPGYPHVAVHDPDQGVGGGIAVCAADVADLGVGPQLVAVEARDQRVVLLDEEADVVSLPIAAAPEVIDDFLENRVSRVVLGRDAEVDGQLGPRVGLAERGGEAFV